MEKQCLSTIHEKLYISERVDLSKNLQSSHSFLCLGDSVGESSQLKRKRILKPAESDSDSSSDSDDEPDDEETVDSAPDNTSSYRIPKKGRRIWDAKQMENLRKNFKNIEHLECLGLPLLPGHFIKRGKKKKKPAF